MVYLYDDMDLFTENAYDFFYQHISLQRQKQLEKFHFFRDKKQGMIAYLLLRYGLQHEFRKRIIPEFYFAEYGKPYIKDFNHIYFNFSHCAYGVICGISNCEIGVDIQNKANYDYKIASKIMCENEIQRIEDSDDKDFSYTILWALKESYVKYSGKGIGRYIQRIDFSDYSLDSYIKYGCIFRIIPNNNNIVSTTCCTQEKEIMNVNLEMLKHI